MISTNFTIDAIPHSEYPRPQMQRDNWLNLNGQWDLAKVKADDTVAPTEYQKVLVPFSPETQASGIGNGFTLGDDEKLVYKRTFNIDHIPHGGVTYLHFGAVDQVCTAYINGVKVGYHKGGFTQFTFDVTAAVKTGENEIVVEVIDVTEKSEGARGKQSSTPQGIWYTKQSGIWQTVWLETVPAIHVKSLKILPDAIKKEVTIYSDCEKNQTISVFDDGKRIFTADFDDKKVVVKYDFTLWSPENPKLYDFIIRTQTGDVVKSYFGVRSFGICDDAKGRKRLTLNGKPYFMSGVLDQGYWPESLLTAPSDEALRFDVQLLKDMGFNMVRKHIKLEPMRWYYYCDKMGLIVWQDFVSGGGIYKFSHVALMPFLGIGHKDSDYKYFARELKEGRDEYWQAVDETVNSLYNCPSIGVWVPFNEGWGQFDSAAVTKYVAEIDSTRLIDSASGWHDQGVGKTAMNSRHIYFTKLKAPRDKHRPVVLSEFGGYAYNVAEHEHGQRKSFSYRDYANQEEYAAAVQELFLSSLVPQVEKGFCASVYTQLSDVEQEINGLITYDRKVVKMPVDKMKSINKALLSIAANIK